MNKQNALWAVLLAPLIVSAAIIFISRDTGITLLCRYSAVLVCFLAGAHFCQSPPGKRVYWLFPIFFIWAFAPLLSPYTDNWPRYLIFFNAVFLVGFGIAGGKGNKPFPGARKVELGGAAMLLLQSFF